MSKELEYKNIFVTGGSRDIGASIVDNLLDNGANVGYCFYHQSQEREITNPNLFAIKADLKTIQGRKEISTIVARKFRDQWDGLILNASDNSLELNVKANLDLFYEFESYYLFDPEPSRSVILMQSVPGHFYDRLGKDWVPEFYNPIAKAKNKGEKEISKIRQIGGLDISIVCPPAVVDTTNWTQFKRYRDREIDVKHKKITDALGLPTEVTADDVGKKVAELLANPPKFGSVEYFNETKDAKVYLAAIYGPSLRLPDTFNVEEKSAWMIVTRRHCKDHFLGNPILPGFLIEEAAAQSAALIAAGGEFGVDLPILKGRSVDDFKSKSKPGDILKFQMEDYEIAKRRFSGKVIVTNEENLVAEVFIKGAFFPRRFLR